MINAKIFAYVSVALVILVGIALAVYSATRSKTTDVKTTTTKSSSAAVQSQLATVQSQLDQLKTTVASRLDGVTGPTGPTGPTGSVPFFRRYRCALPGFVYPAQINSLRFKFSWGSVSFQARFVIQLRMSTNNSNNGGSLIFNLSYINAFGVGDSGVSKIDIQTEQSQMQMQWGGTNTPQVTVTQTRLNPADGWSPTQVTVNVNWTPLGDYAQSKCGSDGKCWTSPMALVEVFNLDGGDNAKLESFSDSANRTGTIMVL